MANQNTKPEDTILAQIKEEYSRDQIYTSIGSNALISVNPYKSVLSSSDSTSQIYFKHLQDTSSDKPELPAHVFSIANSAYYHLLNDKHDQSVIITGESGSGKTEACQLLIRHFCQLSRKKWDTPDIVTSKSNNSSFPKDSKLIKGAKLLQSILNPFICSKTPSNQHASRAGKWIEMQFNTKGKLVGIKLLDYLLEKPRVTSYNSDERNFDIFYHFLAGAKPDEKHEFELHDPSYYKYLSHFSQNQLTPYDSIKYHELRDDMKSVGIGKRQQHEIFKILAAILHLGNVDFEDEKENHNDPACIINYDQLECVATLLGVEPENLELTLTYKTKFIKNELYTVFLNADLSRKQRDHLASTLYSLVVRWIVEHLNTRLCQEDCANFIGILDFPGFQDTSKNGLYNLLYNFAAEKVIKLSTTDFFSTAFDMYNEAGLDVSYRPAIKDNSQLLEIIERRDKVSIFGLIDEESTKVLKDKKADHRIAQDILNQFEGSGIIVSTKKQTSIFTIRHFLGSVDYYSENFKFRNTDAMSSDFITLARGDKKDGAASENMFLQELFSDKMVSLERYSKDNSTVMNAQNPSIPARKPSIKRKSKTNKDDPMNLFNQSTLISNFQNSFEELVETLSGTKAWYIFCIKPNDEQMADRLDQRKIKVQLQALKIPEIAVALSKHDYSLSLPFAEFYNRYSRIIDPLNISETNKMKLCTEFMLRSGWQEPLVAISTKNVFFGEYVYRLLEDEMHYLEQQFSIQKEKSRMAGDASSFISSDDGSQYESDTDSVFLYENRVSLTPRYGNQTKLLADESTGRGQSTGSLLQKTVHKPPKGKRTAARKRWVCFTWCMTCYILPVYLSWCGGMKRKDVQMAWREKVALCIIIFFLCATLLFFIIGLGRVICPRVDVFSRPEFENRNKPDDAWTYAYGRVYRVDELISDHLKSYDIPTFAWDPHLGNTDVADLFFKVPLWSLYCPNIQQPEPTWDNTLRRRPESSFNYIYYHRGVLPTSNDFKLYLEYMNRYAKGKLGWGLADVKKFASSDRRLIILNQNVYDVSSYYNSVIKFFGEEVEIPFASEGQDVTSVFNNAFGNNLERKRQVLNCMNEMFYVGVVDPRESISCQISNWLLVASSAVILLVIGFKFLAALHFGSTDDPEDHDKFVICQVPCYTEGAEGLSNTLDSLALTKYDDKRKLLFIICDGMIIGSGNDRPTPRIVLDLLGVDPTYDPEPKVFLSLGDGDRQHNIGKVYSGLYDVQGHAVPFIVIVKVGKSSEKQRPGNRGKRDSQMILMRFLSKVHFNSEMNPLELELYHHMKNIIGVNPSYYEYVLMVDSDTEVMPDAMNRLVSVMIHDSKIMGLCGETLLSNEKESLITMIQVYEYFISHHLAKAFESLFGSVTCLPGCFSMYRIRSPMNNIPLLIAPSVVNDYSENIVDTLHKKNLLHLGEDRYLTTLMLKHFPSYKLSFTPDAQCRTNAPEHWSVFKSQRRRWINSTVHNLFELVGLPGLCGVCCLSMRFIVYLELFSTLVQPSALVYIIYLIVTLIITPPASSAYTFPLVSVIMIAGIYGLQVIIFILKRQWGMIIWMIIYLLATPVFAFYLPLYSFWHFDDFSWGNTRIVVGDDGKKVAHAVEYIPFDPSIIPLKKWRDYSVTLEPENKETIVNYPPSFDVKLDKRASILSNPFMSLQQPLLPSEEEIFMEVKRILSGADLMTITKKQVREDLSNHFKVDLTEKKNIINEMIEGILSGRI